MNYKEVEKAIKENIPFTHNGTMTGKIIEQVYSNNAGDERVDIIY